MATVREQICTASNACDGCGQPIKLAYIIEWRSYKRELCYKCAESIRLQLTKVLHAGRAPRRKKQSRTGGTRESWEDVT